MSKRKYSEVEMIGALKQMEAGRSAAEVGRELGISKHTIYAIRSTAGGRSYAVKRCRCRMIPCAEKWGSSGSQGDPVKGKSALRAARRTVFVAARF